MIYVIQRNHHSDNYPVLYAGSSAHKALLAASKVESVKVTVWKNGAKFKVTDSNDGKPE